MVTKSNTADRILRWPEVHERVGYCRSNIYYLIQANEFPSPIKLGARAVGWLESDIDDWMEYRISFSRDGSGS